MGIKHKEETLMKKILSLLLTLAMVLSWLPSAALATKNTEFPPGPDTASLEEQMQRALFSADLRQYSEDCEEPERYDPDETFRLSGNNLGWSPSIARPAWSIWLLTTFAGAM